MMTIELIPLLQDNYAYLLITENGTVAIVDPAEAEPVQDLLDARNLKLHYILNTHHHGDHTGGNMTLKNAYSCPVVGPAADAHRIKELDTGLSDGDTFALGDQTAQVIATPGHTSGHISFYVPAANALFCGDTLFALGCGRLFEGTPDQMWNSLQKLAALPDDTRVYCGHEYTEANAAFCLTVEPDNEALKKRAEDIKGLRQQELPTIPSTIGLEKETNVFLRAGSAERFATIRALKDAA